MPKQKRGRMINRLHYHMLKNYINDDEPLTLREMFVKSGMRHNMESWRIIETLVQLNLIEKLEEDCFDLIELDSDRFFDVWQAHEHTKWLKRNAEK